MTQPAHIKTIIYLTEFKLKEKGSQFLSFSKPIQNEEEATSYLAEIKKKFYDASHHCYSYKIKDGSFKYSDDGEPNGTAGIRIYNAQNHFDLTNLITIVVRYFGGTKLGVGPLGKAYYDAAMESLKNAKLISLAIYQLVEIKFDFAMSKSVHHFINKFNAIIQENVFDDKPGIVLLIKPEYLENFANELSFASGNKCKIYPKENFQYLTSDQKS